MAGRNVQGIDLNWCTNSNKTERIATDKRRRYKGTDIVMHWTEQRYYELATRIYHAAPRMCSGESYTLTHHIWIMTFSLGIRLKQTLIDQLLDSHIMLRDQIVSFAAMYNKDVASDYGISTEPWSEIGSSLYIRKRDKKANDYMTPKAYSNAYSSPYT